MATTINFNPSPSTPFSFQAQLDGITYNVIITWNLYGQRYYINVYSITNILIVSMPLIGSPLNYPISLVAGYFNSTLVYYDANQQFVISP